VAVDGEGISLRIGARLGVLLNAGGFARNQAMLDRHIPGTRAEWSSVIAADDGAMIEEGQRLGAATAQMNTRIGMQVALPPGSEKLAVKPGLQNDICKPHAIVVDQAGQRYANEASSHAEFTHRMIAHGASASPSWMIFDSQFLSTYMLAGTMPGKKKPSAWTASKFLRQADTLQALATDCGIDAARLRATVERFNGFVRTGRDTDFRRGDAPYDRWTGDALLPAPSNTLGAIDKGPYYAVQMVPGDVSTFGGLVTDVHARVLKPDGSVIPGLYATGTTTASVMGAVEPGPGGSIGPAFTWGYVAAKHALSRAVTTTSEPAAAVA
jgi:3-oxosteroid 1-dehydrogenase